jgi:hypothetical protein
MTQLQLQPPALLPGGIVSHGMGFKRTVKYTHLDVARIQMLVVVWESRAKVVSNSVLMEISN